MIKKVFSILFILIFFNNCSWGQNAPHATFNSSTNSYIDFGPGTNLNCYDTLSKGDQLSITLWARWVDFSDSGVGPWANLVTINDSTSSGDNGVWWVQHNGSNTRFEFALHTTSRSFILSSTAPVAGTWYHLACIYNGSQMRIYLNGVLENTAAKSGNIRPFPLASKLNMGRWSNPANNYRRFNGNMDEISIWNIALSPTQINNIMTNPESVTGVNYDTTGILGYWNFDDNTANDLSPCANNGLVGIETVLPIELLNFDVAWKDDNVALTWTTLSEINNDYFTIERSFDAYYWVAINEISGAGNSSSPLTYFAKDDVLHLNSSSPIYYRLKQTDFDGNYSYSKIETINNKILLNTGSFIYPNPTSNKLTVELATFNTKTTFTLVDNLGRTVYSVTPTNKLTVLNLDRFAKGVYTLLVKTDNGVISKKIIKK